LGGKNRNNAVVEKYFNMTSSLPKVKATIKVKSKCLSTGIFLFSALLFRAREEMKQK